MERFATSGTMISTVVNFHDARDYTNVLPAQVNGIQQENVSQLKLEPVTQPNKTNELAGSAGMRIKVTSKVESKIKEQVKRIDKNKSTQVFTSKPRLSRHIVELGKPSNKAAETTLTAIPPPDQPWSKQELTMWNQLDKEVFKIMTPIKVDMVEHLTKHHPNRPYVEYILQGLRQGFRISYHETRSRIVLANLNSIDEAPEAFRKAVRKEAELG